ncbi:Uncharacterised protein [Halioglobus japonicus]|nr:Uncharacterised protein [Halioglobus japonicus]
MESIDDTVACSSLTRTTEQGWESPAAVPNITQRPVMMLSTKLSRALDNATFMLRSAKVAL